MSSLISALSSSVLSSHSQLNSKVGTLASQVVAQKNNKLWLTIQLPTLHQAICDANLDIPDIIAIYEVYSGWELPDDFKRTCLFAGVRGDDDSVVQRVLDSGADVNSRDHLGRTPLHVAA